MFSRLPILAATGLLLTIAAPAFPQGSAGGFWQKYDKNGDGSLDPSEIPPGMKSLVERSITGLGLDPTKPISIQQLQGGSSAAAPGSTPLSPSSTTPATTSQSTPPTSSTD